MDCHETKDRLLEGREGAAVRRHLRRCGDCEAYARELAAGGREIAEGFLARAPSPGFEERVMAGLAEQEIPVRTGPVIRPAGLVAAALLLLLAGSVALLITRGDAPPPAGSEEPLLVVTEPVRENPLAIVLHREVTEGPTELVLSFAGESRVLPGASELEGELHDAWTRGARRVRMTVAPEVPGREIMTAIEALEKAGYSFELTRVKPPLL